MPLLSPLRVAAVAMLAASPLLSSSAAVQNPFRVFTVEVISVRPHDLRAFTQGLLYYNGHLYESTGLNGQSSVRRVDPLTGRVLLKTSLPHEYFGEGLVLVDDELYQLTWKNEKGFVYDRETLEKLREFTYEGEGWGLEFDGMNFISTDGSEMLFFRDRETFEVLHQVPVTIAGRPLPRINELELVDGILYANVWQTKNIVMINPRSGRVTGVVRVDGLLTAEEAHNVDVLNGIAHNSESGNFYITGKLWPSLFEVRFVPQ